MQNRTAVALGVATAFLVALPAVAQQVGFRDVPADAYFTEAVAELSRIGVIRGYDDGRFGPDDLVTRGQVAVMFDRYDRAVVDPLRRQVEEMRRMLGLADEQGIPGCFGRRIGESFPSPDGCNTCTCTESGAACTKRACAPDPRGEKCFSSDDCAGAEVCTTERGACESACEPGAEACIDVCAGRCVPRDERLSCEGEKSDFDRAVAENLSCDTDDDCVIVQQGCPFVTCGVAVNRDGEAAVRAAADDAASCQEATGNVSCARCRMTAAFCERGRCVQR